MLPRSSDNFVSPVLAQSRCLFSDNGPMRFYKRLIDLHHKMSAMLKSPGNIAYNSLSGYSGQLLSHSASISRLIRLMTTIFMGFPRNLSLSEGFKVSLYGVSFVSFCAHRLFQTVIDHAEVYKPPFHVLRSSKLHPSPTQFQPLTTHPIPSRCTL